MSDAPRASEEWRRLQRDETGRYSSDVTYGDLAHGMSAFAKQLERELADVTKQRDALVEACSLTLKRGDIVQRSDQYMREVLSVNRSALAAVKGGGT